jgi:hypothetical protein
MKSHFIRCLSFALIWLAASSAAQAGIHVNVDLNPFVWGPPPPPVVYEPPRYYAPPPVVYYGHGYWGDRDWRRHDDWRERHDRGGHDRR